ncbi:MAG TPA: hypothetical protein VEA99_00295 [Gemmatimonadaceae bacterium]|nr:hypothetical protein [Gemmatimonadaceae bacterium]
MSNTRRLVQLVTLAATLTGLGACASIPQRAWQNGEAMSTSNAYRRMMAGDRSVMTQRQLYSSSTPLRHWHSDRPYQPFSRF